GEPDEQESCGERETRAAQSRTGKNSRATCSSSGSFFLITSYSRSVSCMDPSACMLTWPSSEKSGLDILCPASTASVLQPIFAETSFAASFVWSFMKRKAPKIAFWALRIWSAFFLIPSSEAYWIWLIHLGVTASSRSNTLDLPASCVPAPASPQTKAAISLQIGRAACRDSGEV